MHEEVDWTAESWAAEESERTRASVYSQLEDAVFVAAWEQGRTLTLDEAVALALES